jgi:hypothetical protein
VAFDIGPFTRLLHPSKYVEGEIRLTPAVGYPLKESGTYRLRLTYTVKPYLKHGLWVGAIQSNWTTFHWNRTPRLPTR